MRRQQAGSFFIGLLILLFFGAAAVSLIRSVSLDTPPPVVTAALAFGSGLLLQAATSAFQKRREIEADQRKEKARVYEGFMNLWFDEMMLPSMLSRNDSAGDSASSEELIRKMGEFTKKVILWGSDDVVREYSNYRKLLTGQSSGEPRPLAPSLQGLERLFFAFRKDLGYQNRGLKERDLLALFINDLHEPAPDAKLGLVSMHTSPVPASTSRVDFATDPPSSKLSA